MSRVHLLVFFGGTFGERDTMPALLFDGDYGKSGRTASGVVLRRLRWMDQMGSKAARARRSARIRDAFRQAQGRKNGRYS